MMSDLKKMIRILKMNRVLCGFAFACLLSGMTVLGLGGCADPVEELNYVQPHYVDKERFEGEWYFQQTVVDVSPEVSLGFIGYEGNVDKIRWEITEDMLYAYRTFEPIIGLDSDDTREGGDFEGDPVAAFRITSHFDIQRAYNTATGEPSNVITENWMDRPWYEREYMRVDWSSNRVPGPADLTVVWYYSQTSDYVRETETFDPDHLIIDDDYLQMTMTAMLSDGGMTCFYSYGSTQCGSAEARLRFSFLKVKPEDEVGFQPLPYPDNVPLARLKGTDEACPYGVYDAEFIQECEKVRSTGFRLGKDNQLVEYACTPDFIDLVNTTLVGQEGYLQRQDCQVETVPMFERFGYFRTERFAYNRQLGGAHDSQREFYANHHSIWRDAEQTHPKPIIYYTNPAYPQDLEDVTSQIGNEWDKPFLESVMLKTGLSEDEVRDRLVEDARQEGVESWMFLDGDVLQAGGMFQVRRNHCSVEGVQAYMSRFDEKQAQQTQLQQMIDEATQGNDVLDGNLLKVCAGLRWLSRKEKFEPEFHWQQLGDLRYSFVNWVHAPQPSGPLGYGPSSSDPENGRLLKGSANVYGAAVDSYARGAADLIRVMNEDLDLETLLSGESYKQWLESAQELNTQRSALKIEDVDQDENAQGFDVVAAYGEYKDENGRVDVAAFQRHLQRRLETLSHHDPLHSAQEDAHQAQARWEKLQQDPRFAERARVPEHVALFKAMMGQNQAEEPSEEAMNSALQMSLNPVEHQEHQQKRVKFFAEQNMLMADFIDDSVIGLALQLKGREPEEVYQLLRREIYRAVMLHEIGHTLGLTHNFSASFDALNYPDQFWEIYQQSDNDDVQDRSRISEYRYTSIMDYGSRFNSDIHGLGRYDHAAIKFVYGRGQVETFEDGAEVPFGIDLEILINGYEEIPNLLNQNLEVLRNRKHQGLSVLATDRVKGLYKNSKVLVEDPQGSLAAADLLDAGPDAEVPEWEGYYYHDPVIPYKYCFDFYNGNLDCKTWDEGASHVDVVEGAIQNYWNYHIFNQYRRGRSQNSFINGYFGRQSRLGFYLSYPFRYYYFYQNYDLNLRSDLFNAAVISLNFINQVLGAPQPGPHCYDEVNQIYVPKYQLDTNQACVDEMNVPLGVGREYLMRRNGEYQAQIDYIGSYFDKFNLLFYLTDTSSQFFRVSNLGDNRAFSIGYYRVYRNPIVRLMRDLVFSWLEERTADGFEYLYRDQEFEPRALVQKAAYEQDGDLSEVPRVQAAVSYNLVWQGLVLNSVFNTSTYDGEVDFIEYLTVSEEGTGEDRDYEEGIEVARFNHPHSGITYKAAQSIDQNSIAFEVVQRAQKWVDDVWSPAKAILESDPEDPQAQAEFMRAEQQLGRYTDLIQDFRLLRSALDFYND